MTPTERDKELRQKMQDIFNDCTSGWLITIKNFNGYERELGDMESEIIGDILDLITADRKRVALEARIDSLLAAKKRIYETDAFELGLALGIIDSELKKLGWTPGELKAQQEEV